MSEGVHDDLGLEPNGGQHPVLSGFRSVGGWILGKALNQTSKAATDTTHVMTNVNAGYIENLMAVKP